MLHDDDVRHDEIWSNKHTYIGIQYLLCWLEYIYHLLVKLSIALLLNLSIPTVR